MREIVGSLEQLLKHTKGNAVYIKKIILSMKTIHNPNTIRSNLGHNRTNGAVYWL